MQWMNAASRAFVPSSRSGPAGSTWKACWNLCATVAAQLME
jgi:hypothetical protein